MKGSYTIHIKKSRVVFTLDVERNITVICGNSASGKTTMYNCVADYEEYGPQSGVVIDSPVECRVLRGRNWHSELSEIKSSFVFVDEGSSFLATKEFAEAIRGTDNYYIFITRESLFQLPYSVNSILEMRKTTSRFKVTYNRTYPRYDRVKDMKLVLGRISGIVTEDSNSGNELFSVIAQREGMSCISAGGKSRILSTLVDHSDKKWLVVADGAAFGAEMAEVHSYVKEHENDMLLYLPESTEWLILSAGIIRDAGVGNILDKPAEYIECSEFFSWEQFFTQLLVSKTAGSAAAYSKKRLNEYYKQDESIKKIREAIEGN